MYRDRTVYLIGNTYMGRQRTVKQGERDREKIKDGWKYHNPILAAGSDLILSHYHPCILRVNIFNTGKRCREYIDDTLTYIFVHENL